MVRCKGKAVVTIMKQRCHDGRKEASSKKMAVGAVLQEYTMQQGNGLHKRRGQVGKWT